jgi:lipopolysaccharide transport system ATP-binding protein
MIHSDTAISVRGLSKAYIIDSNAGPRRTFGEEIMNRLRHPFRRVETDTFWALRDVSFEVKTGEVVGIIGRNGAGKSTLLKILSRITEPTAGKISLYGRVGSLLEVGTGFHPELTGRENIYLNGAILGMTRGEIRREFDAIVEFAEVEQFLETPVKRYSSGMYVRLAFAVAAHLNPEILVVDEVLAVGDMAFQRKCLGKMTEIAETGRTVLFVSHNMAAVSRLCTRGIMLTRGQVSFDGSTADCVAQYLRDGIAEGETIESAIRILNKSFTIDSIEVNGSNSNLCQLEADGTELKIDIAGTLDRPMQFDLEARLYDRNETPLAFFSPSHETGQAQKFSVGKFSLSRSIRLPRMNRGTYLVTLLLARAGVECFVEIPHAFKIVCQGAATATGYTFDYDSGAGWLLLHNA